MTIPYDTQMVFILPCIILCTDTLGIVENQKDRAEYGTQWSDLVGLLVKDSLD